MQKQQTKLLEDIPGLCMSLGICKAKYQNNQLVLSHMPVSLFPYVMRASIYDKLKQAHVIWQKLFVKVSNNSEFIIKIAQTFSKNDPYMSHILDIYKNNLKNKKSSLAKVACTRVDYMGDEHPLVVQYNLMSVGLNAMSDRVQNLHEILNRHHYPHGRYTYPKNHNLQTICKAILLALQQSKLSKGLILMVVHENQFNYGDHYAFRMQMIKRGNRVQPITMDQLIKTMQFDDQTQVASIGGTKIDAFYFRTGYSPQHFPTAQHWQARLKIENSRSVKLPSVDMILVNTKRFQSELAKLEVMQKFICPQQAQLLASISGEIYDFDDMPDTQIQRLIEKTAEEEYVLKPNKEGGGNNFFGQKAAQKLKQLYKQRTHLQNYILMKKIKSTVHDNHFIFDHNSVYVPKSTAQFSTLGCFVYKDGMSISNEMGGTLVRLKRQEVNEGGIAINQGVISGACIQNFSDK